MAKSIPDFELADALLELDKAFGWSLEDHSQHWPIPVATHRSYQRAHRQATKETIQALYAAYKKTGGLLERPAAQAGVWRQEAKWKALNELKALSSRRTVRLSEQLKRVHGLTRLRLLLGKIGRLRSDMELIDAALKLIDQTDKARLAELLVSLTEHHWDSGLLEIEVAAVVLQRLSEFWLPERSSVRLFQLVEHAVKECDRRRVAVLEPLCMGTMELRKPGAFIAHAKHLLENRPWREEDSKVRSRYYRTWDETRRNVVRHVESRPVELRCHDAGTVIELAARGHLCEDQKEWLADEMSLSLRAVNVGEPLVGTFRDSIFIARR